MLLDTNILIYYLNTSLPPHGHQLIDDAIKNGAHISVISRIEVLGWPGHSEQSAQKTRQFLIQHLDEYPLTEAIVHRCITLRQQHQISVPDSIIAATALHLQMPLVTRNTDDFKAIENITLINPFDLLPENTNTEQTPTHEP